MKRRRNVLAQVKGYRFGRGTKERQAREAIAHAGVHAFAHRRDKKNDFRRLWQVQINAALRSPEGPTSPAKPLSYSTFIARMKKAGIALDRKILASLAENHPETFKRVIEQTMK